jgi:hypothetical protein
MSLFPPATRARICKPVKEPRNRLSGGAAVFIGRSGGFYREERRILSGGAAVFIGRSGGFIGRSGGGGDDRSFQYGGGGRRPYNRGWTPRGKRRN